MRSSEQPPADKPPLLRWMTRRWKSSPAENASTADTSPPRREASVPETPSPPTDGAIRQVLLAGYAELGQRRRTFDTLLWTVPSFTIAAWAFLIKEALSRSNASGVRLFEALAALGLAAFAFLLSARLRYLENRDARLLEELERRTGFRYASGGMRIYGDPDKVDGQDALKGFCGPWLGKKRAHRVWQTALGSLFGYAAGVAVYIAARWII